MFFKDTAGCLTLKLHLSLRHFVEEIVGRKMMAITYNGRLAKYCVSRRVGY